MRGRWRQREGEGVSSEQVIDLIGDGKGSFDSVDRRNLDIGCPSPNS